MAHFYGEMEGSRKPVTKTGDKRSGIRAHLRGWNIGVKVECCYDEKTNKDVIYIYRTHGSNGKGSDELIRLIKEE